MNMEARLEAILSARFGATLGAAAKEQVFSALMQLTREEMAARQPYAGRRRLYYVSAEFLIGKLLSNNLIALGLFDEARSVLEKHGLALEEIEEGENEPSLGNGGLGRLAACFLDSIAALGLCGDGAGLLYRNGLFRQSFEGLKQQESPDPWLGGEDFLRETGVTFDVPLGGETVTARMLDIDVPGKDGGKNTLHLFDLPTVCDDVITSGIGFDKTDIRRNLTLFLYPDDSDEAGRLLRVYQQVFLVSCTAQLILRELRERGQSARNLHEHVVVQINDTHPTMIIPELIRLLLEEGLTMDEAVAEVERTCAYTNHTILAEALERWPVSFIRAAAPQLMPIIEELDRRACARSSDPRVRIIRDGHVHMAHIDIHFGFSVNGVAALHTQILKESELRPFYDLYPEKFSNKTNGITFRRWLEHCNAPLAGLITARIGDGWKKDAMQLERLMDYAGDEETLDALLEIKAQHKRDFAAQLEKRQGIVIDPDSVYDVQIKRLHEYKRQQMNALYAIWKYQQIKAGHIPPRPITLIFGAKAAPAYVIAKDIIHLILCLQQLVSSDPAVSKHMKIVMLENYNVTYAQQIIPACDISEQISLASKEASGTGNMKLMLSGAVTLGTMDGANVEIAQLVGRENIAVFGRDSDTVIGLYANKGYSAKAMMKDKLIRKLVYFIVSPQMKAIGDEKSLARLHHEIVSKDWFMTLLDLREYISAKEALLERYEDRRAWAGMMLTNIAHAGYFSSDRTIAQYNEDIWHIDAAE